jgi:hypothetical protein
MEKMTRDEVFEMYKDAHVLNTSSKECPACNAIRAKLVELNAVKSEAGTPLKSGSDALNGVAPNRLSGSDREARPDAQQSQAKMPDETKNSK